jgi:hypothetical protein
MQNVSRETLRRSVARTGITIRHFLLCGHRSGRYADVWPMNPFDARTVASF